MKQIENWHLSINILLDVDGIAIDGGVGWREIWIKEINCSVFSYKYLYSHAKLQSCSSNSWYYLNSKNVRARCFKKHINK